MGAEHQPWSRPLTIDLDDQIADITAVFALRLRRIMPDIVCRNANLDQAIPQDACNASLSAGCAVDGQQGHQVFDGLFYHGGGHSIASVASFASFARVVVS